MTYVLIATPGEGIQNARELIFRAGLAPDFMKKTYSAFSPDNKVAAFFRTEAALHVGGVAPGVSLQTAQNFPTLPTGWKRLSGSPDDAVLLPESLEKLLAGEIA